MQRIQSIRRIFRPIRISLRAWLLIWSLVAVSVGMGARWFATPTAYDGFCPVTLWDQETWREGRWYIGTIHQRQRYLFADWQQKRAFDANPQRYVPVASGIDIVVFTTEGRVVRGKRESGMWYREKVYLFSSEETLQQFCQSPEQFAARASEAFDDENSR